MFLRKNYTEIGQNFLWTHKMRRDFFGFWTLKLKENRLIFPQFWPILKDLEGVFDSHRAIFYRNN